MRPRPALASPTRLGLHAALAAMLALALGAADAPGGTAPTPKPSPARPFVSARTGLAPKPVKPTAAAPVAPPAEPARPGARLAPGQPVPPAELEAFVDGAIRDARAADHIAGATVAVVQNGQVVLLKGYGFAGVAPSKPVDPHQTLFRLGSVSKTFTWITVLKAVEAGRMKLDAPMNTYLPQGLKMPDDSFDKPILVKHLMSHTAGLETRDLGRLFEQDPDNIRPLGTFLQRGRPRRVRDPGELSTYSNYGAALAGAAVSAAEGQNFEHLAETEIFQPLGMSHTTFREPYPARDDLPAPMAPDLASGLSTGFHWTGARFKARPFEFASQAAPALSASATADDMARYLTALLNDGKVGETAIYGPQTAHALRTTLQANAPGMNGWAHGFMEYSLPGGFQGFGHDGETLSFNANVTTVPDLGLGVFVATNTDTGARLTQRLPSAIVERFYACPREQLRPGSDILTGRRADYDGLYLTTRRSHHGLEKFVDRLSGVWRVKVGDDGRLTVAQGRRGRSFVPDGAPGHFRAADGDDVLAFAPAAGKARLFYFPSGNGAAERIGWLYRPATLAIAALLTLIASLAVIGGLFQRDLRDFRQARIQILADRTQAVTALVWLLAGAGFTVWAVRTADPAWLMYNWPNPWLIGASWLALVAGLLSLVLIVQLPAVWRGERRLPGWSDWRKLRHSLTVLIYLALTVVLGAWGALEPWAG